MGLASGLLLVWLGRRPKLMGPLPAFHPIDLPEVWALASYGRPSLIRHRIILEAAALI